jgi:hypothetical protein
VSNLSLKLLVFYSLLEHCDPIFVVRLDCINYFLFVVLLLDLVLFEFSLFSQQLILLQLRCKLVYLLAESDLLCVTLVHETLLLVEEFFFELLFLDHLYL